MIDGANLAATAKHCPERLDPNEVRAAGRQLELFADLLAGLSQVNHGTANSKTILTFVIDRDVADQVLYHRYCD